MIVFYHNDLDGRCAAAVAAFHDCSPDIRFIEITYGDPVPFDLIQPGEVVYVLDFSFQSPGEWDRLRSITENIVWIDHHETALNAAPKWLNDRPGIRDTARCGAWLTWEYFTDPKWDRPAPECVRLVDLWDRWKHNDSPEVLNFVSGTMVRDMHPKSEDWYHLLSGDANILRVIQNEGELVRRVQAIDYAEDVKSNAYLIQWEDNDCLVLHRNKGGSKAFDCVPIADKPPVLILARFNGKQWSVSLYSDSVKVNNIAVKYGGGGHPGAAGFQIAKLPWLEG